MPFFCKLTASCFSWLLCSVSHIGSGWGVAHKHLWRKDASRRPLSESVAHEGTSVLPATAPATVPMLKACVKDRVQKARDMRPHGNFSRWYENLSPNVARAFKRLETQPGKGAAILMTGQVRTGIETKVIANLRRHVFKPLLSRSSGNATFPVETFAFLEFTSGGFSWQPDVVGHRDRTRDINRSAVEKMLRGYGAKYTLEEAVGGHRQPDMTGCIKGAGYGFAAQWIKVHAAIQMMEEREQQLGEQFEYVVRLRPDILLWNVIDLDPIKAIKQNVPFVCANGGGQDAVLSMKRWAAEALGSAWRTMADCNSPDHCRTQVLIDDCKAYHSHNRSSMMDWWNGACGHMLWISLWRQGVQVATCFNAVSFERPSSNGSWYTIPVNDTVKLH
mmetsp:Transcript_112860/g.205109  ORF Transcript_112860/g.205109 Transcript_112860/m.205109 type:complete len:389 (+) Transcript_112860:36-1202(+)